MYLIISQFCSPRIAELTANENMSNDEEDQKKSTSAQPANISFFAQWVQQERFPQFVKVIQSIHLLVRMFNYNINFILATKIQIYYCCLDYQREVQPSPFNAKTIGNGSSGGEPHRTTNPRYGRI